MTLTILISSVLVFHVFVGFALDDVFVISRTSGLQGQAWNGKDSFKIRPSICDPATATTGDECEPFQADPPANNLPKCCCPCTTSRPTFAFLNNAWQCYENIHIRVLQDCNHTSYFWNEATNPPSELWALNAPDLVPTNIPFGGSNGLQSCEVLPNSSWYFGCNGKRVKSPLYQRKMTDLFALSNPFGGAVVNRFSLEVRGGVLNAHLLQGKIINLAIRCNRSNSNVQFHSCLMFKLLGDQICPEPEPQLQTFSTTSPGTPSLTGNISPTSVKFFATFPGGNVRPGPGPGGGSQSSSRTIGVIAAVTVSIAFLIAIIITLLVYRDRHPSNKEPNASKGSANGNYQDAVAMNTLPNSMIQKEDENGYRALSDGATRQPPIYATNYNVPRRREHSGIGHNSVLPLDISEEQNMYGPGNSRELDPVYRDFEESSTKNKVTGLENGCIRLDQPVYNILEELSTQKGPVRPNNCDTKPGAKHVLQRLCLENAKKDSKDGGCTSSERHSIEEGSKDPMSDSTEPGNKVLVGPVAKEFTGHHGVGATKGPLYYTLEKSHQNDPHGESGKNFECQSNIVYHVLEENTYLNTSSVHERE